MNDENKVIFFAIFTVGLLTIMTISYDHYTTTKRNLEWLENLAIDRGDMIQELRKEVISLETENDNYKKNNERLNTRVDDLGQRAMLCVYSYNDLKDYVPAYITQLRSFRSEHTYSYPDYICGDFADDYIREIRAMGYSARKKSVTMEDCSDFNRAQFKCKHYVVEIDNIIVDPTNYNYEISPEDYDIYYK